MKGSQFLSTLPPTANPEREARILEAVRSGYSMPLEWHGVTVEHGGHHGIVRVAGDALAIGEADDWVRVSMGHWTAQRIADALGARLPTTKISDLAFLQATVRLAQKKHGNVTDAFRQSTELMKQYHHEVEQLRNGRVGLIRPAGKDFVLTNRLLGKPKKSAIYGWHTSANNPAGFSLGQPLYEKHDAEYADYSQLVYLVHPTMIVDGKNVALDDVLTSPMLCGLVSSEGPLRLTRHSGVSMH